MTGRVLFLAFCLVMHPFMLFIHANEDADALMAFKKNLRHPDPNLFSDWTSNDYLGGPCAPGRPWSLVTCAGQNVIELNLGRRGLSGSLVSNLGNLQYLQKLYLQDNSLTGSIPAELGNLINLKYLYLHKNKLTGSVPSSLGNLHNLQLIYLGNNNLMGCFPQQVIDLFNHKLKVFNVQPNRLLCFPGPRGCPC